MKNLFKVVFVLVIPLILLIMLASGFFHAKIPSGEVEASAKTVSGVKVAEVKLTPAPRQITVPGTIQAKETANLAAKLMARVLAVNVSEGTKVREGEMLVVLDQREPDVQADQARSAINQARAAINQAQSGYAALTSSIKEAKAAREAAQANKDNATSNYNRFKYLYEQGAISKQGFDDMATQLKGAKAGVEQAEARIEALQHQLDQVNAQKEQANAQKSQAEAGLRMAQVFAGYAAVTAPFAGTVIRKMIEVGDMANPGQPLLAVERGPYRLEVPVQESMAGRIVKGQPVRVKVEATNREVIGKVDEIVPAVDAASRTFIVKILIPQDPVLRTGMYGQAIIKAGQENRIMMPEEAVLRWASFTGVYIVDRQRQARLQFVTLGREENGQVEVLSGLNNGDRIIVKGKDRVNDGDKVEEEP